LLDSDKVVITMERVTENGFFTESNWNGGKLIYTSINELENIDYNELWGIIRNGTMFFMERTNRINIIQYAFTQVICRVFIF